MIRGSHVKADQYDGSLPVSLDSLQLRKLWEKNRRNESKNSEKESFPKGFYKSNDKTKSFSDVIINVKFTNDSDFTDIASIKKDLADGIREKDIPEDKMLPGLKSIYIEFLEEFKKNQEYWKKREEDRKKKNDRVVVKPKEPCQISKDAVIDETVVSVNGTGIRVRAKIYNKGNERTEIPIQIYICQKEKNGLYRVVGTFESEEAVIKSGMSKSIRADLDIRDIMMPEEVTIDSPDSETEDTKTVYIVHKGVYRLFIGNDTAQMPAVSLDLPEDISQYIKHENSGWIENEDWTVTSIRSKHDAGPKLILDTGILKTFKKCGDLYNQLLERGCSQIINNPPFASTYEDFIDRLKMSKEALRRRALLYMNGFDFEAKDGLIRHYVVYKRSASKSKTGSCLFIWDKLYEGMMQWTWMGKYFDDSDPQRKYDLTGIKAYEALTLSNIEKIFKLKPNNILLIKEKESMIVKGNRRIVCKETSKAGINTLVVKTLNECGSCADKSCRQEALEYRNNIWDGQALLDESVFKELYGNEKHGMVLLRNHFFKACAFNTRITEYYKENNISAVYDMFGNRYNAKDIKLIITPDSLKYFKFADDLFKTGKGSDDEELNDARCMAYDHWRKNLKTAYFGVVKTDKPSARQGRHKVGYQILNTLPLDEKNVQELFQHEAEYIKSLWEDDELFKKVIPSESAKGKYISRMLEMMDDPDAAVTKDFLCTDDYIAYKRQIISDIKNRMRRGAIDLKGEMLTLCSMPYEMLRYSGLKPLERKKDSTIEPLLSSDEAFIYGLNDNDPVVLCRYPHLSSGAVCGLKNKKCAEYEQWFNLKNDSGSSAIVVISPYNSNIMVKLGGADFDSDTAMFLREPSIIEAVNNLSDRTGIMKKMGDKYAPEQDGLPVAQPSANLVGEVKLYSLSAYEFAMLDKYLAQTQKDIGTVSNDIQLFNSYLWEGLYSGRDDDYCQTVYECILKLSVLNELEIDRSKHSIILPLKSFHDDIMDTLYDGEPILEKPLSSKKIRSFGTTKEIKAYYQPAFLYEIKKERGNSNIALKEKKYWNCPPDHLSKQAALLRKPRRNHVRKKVDFHFSDIPGKADGKQVKRIEEYLKDAVKRLDRIDKRRHKTGEETDERRRIQTDLVDSIAGMKNIRAKNIAAVVRDTMCMKDKDDECYDAFLYLNKYRVLGLLFMVEERMDKKENPVSEILKKITIIDA
ncbi:MAG: hypothetical protein K6F86_00960 [Lachnospiraceae bacterium]|nr:hypothetical protein [Lachnospiraceae bacterium]